MKYFLIIIIAVFFISCSKKDDKPVTDNKTQTEQKQDSPDDTNPADTNLTPEEKFSTSIMTDFLDGPEDEDLQDYLEEEVFKYSGNYTGAAVIELSPSTWLLSLEKNDAVKNYIIQRYVDFKSNDYYFRMKETSLNVSDVFSRSKSKTGAGE
jgi:hypothetical protein